MLLFRFIRDRVKRFYKAPYYEHDLRIDAAAFIAFAVILLTSL